MGNLYAGQLGKHHVSPEIVEVKQDADKDNQAEHEHVLRGPAHLSVGSIHGVTLATTGATVLGREDKSVDNVPHREGAKADCADDSIPVAPQKPAHHVVSIPGKERSDIHAAVESQE